MNNKLTVLLRDFGYQVQGTLLIEKGIRGFTQDRTFRTGIRNLFDAAEVLIPIIRNSEYHSRFTRITEVTR